MVHYLIAMMIILLLTGCNGGGSNTNGGGTPNIPGGTPNIPDDEPGLPTEGPLRVSNQNPRYFSDGNGKTVYLTGSHVWNNFKDMTSSQISTPFPYQTYLDFLESKNHNFIRLWTWELARWSVNGSTYDVDPFPWQRTGPDLANDGKLKFDLTQFNQAYFDRLRERIIAARGRGIYVSIMLFEGYEFEQYTSPTDGFPFNEDNNINGIHVTGIDYNTLGNPAVTRYQEAYVQKVIDTVNDLDNVLYEICNEAGSYSTSWQYHMIDVVKDYENTLPNQHPVGMTFQYEDGNNSTLFASNADWISPNNDGGYIDNPPIPDGSKVVISDSDHLWGEGGDEVWVWKNFTRGLNTLFMDGGIIYFPATNDWRESARDAMGFTLSYAERMDLAETFPQDSTSVCSTTYCLVNPGKQYLVYQPGSGSFTVNLLAGTYKYEWIHPASGEVAETGSISVNSDSRSFNPPDSVKDQAVLFLELDSE